MYNLNDARGRANHYYTIIIILINIHLRINIIYYYNFI